MANPNIATHLPIQPIGTRSGNQEIIQHYLEAAGATFKAGTPVMLNGAGNTQAWDGATVARGIAGVTALQGLNLASAGAGASPIFGSIGFPGGTPTFGSVQNQSAAVNLLHGSPFVDGTTTVYQALYDTIFEAQCDASAGGVFSLGIPAIGTQFGMTVDANGFWYVDISKNTVGVNTVLTVVSLNPQDLVAGSSTSFQNNNRVRFSFNIAASQVQGQ